MRGRWRALRRQWPVLSYYERFEAAVALVLTTVIAVIILVALYRLTVTVATGLLLGALDPLDHRVFQAVFGEIVTLLIALEFNHTLQSSFLTWTNSVPDIFSDSPRLPWCWR